LTDLALAVAGARAAATRVAARMAGIRVRISELSTDGG
jgi:hypothetical protein